jgi:hypothetical protein
VLEHVIFLLVLLHPVLLLLARQLHVQATRLLPCCVAPFEGAAVPAAPHDLLLQHPELFKLKVLKQDRHTRTVSQCMLAASH